MRRKVARELTLADYIKTQVQSWGEAPVTSSVLFFCFKVYCCCSLFLLSSWLLLALCVTAHSGGCGTATTTDVNRRTLCGALLTFHLSLGSRLSSLGSSAFPDWAISPNQFLLHSCAGLSVNFTQPGVIWEEAAFIQKMLASDWPVRRAQPAIGGAPPPPLRQTVLGCGIIAIAASQ